MKQEYMISFMKDFYNISNKINHIRNTSVTFSGNITVNSAGLDFIDTIGKNPNANMSEICLILGLTKGAVSQMATKLQGKGLIKKEKSKDNGKDIYLALTKEGEQINKEQNEIRKKMHEGIKEIVKGYDKKDIEKIGKFLSEISQFMEYYKIEILGGMEK